MFLLVYRCCNLTISPKKVKMTITDAESTIFTGYSISAAGCGQDLANMRAILEFPVTKNRPQLQLWLGIMAGFHVLLCSPQVVKLFDISLPTELLVDSSMVHGDRYILIQWPLGGEEETVNMVWCGSVAVRPSWKNVSPIECKAVCLFWVCCHTDFYL